MIEVYFYHQSFVMWLMPIQGQILRHVPKMTIGKAMATKKSLNLAAEHSIIASVR
jgi:hypothetical protein